MILVSLEMQLNSEQATLSEMQKLLLEFGGK